MFRHSWQLITAASYERLELVPTELWQRVHASAALGAFFVWAADERTRAAHAAQLSRWISQYADNGEAQTASPTRAAAVSEPAWQATALPEATREAAKKLQVPARAVAALWAGAGANPLKAELAVEEQTKEQDGRFRVTAIVSLPLASVLVQPQEHFHVAHLTVAIVARDGKGRITGSPHAEFPIEIPNERLLSAPGQTAGYRFTLYLAPGESVMAVALRDDASGAESVMRMALTPGTETAVGK